MGNHAIGLYKTKNNKYIGLVFMNINAQDLMINKTENKIENNK